MFSWLLRVGLITVSVIAGWFIVGDSPRYQVVELCISAFLVMVILFAAAFWPARWSEYLEKTFRRTR
jgi:hypothetical protein